MRPCPVCGNQVPDTTGQRGRPHVYCSDNCREYSKLLSRLDAYLDRVAARATPEARSRLRAELWALGNATNRHGVPTRIRATASKTRAGWRGLR